MKPMTEVPTIESPTIQPSTASPDGNITTDLIHGESNQAVVDERINDPLRYVDRFRKHRTRSVREVVESATAICDGIDAIRDNSLALERFFNGLADAKVISKAEAEKADLSKMSMISKIRKINEHRNIIVHPNIADKICPGYSVLYELGLLIDKLPGDDNASDQLGKYLEELDGTLTRKWIQERRERIAPKKRRKLAADAEAEEHQSEEDQTEQEVREELEDEADYLEEDDTALDRGTSRSANTDAVATTVIDGGEPITAALLIIEKENENALGRAAQEVAWHRIADRLAKDAVVFIFTPLQSLLNMIPVIGTFGCPHSAGVYMLTEPDERVLTKCNVLAILARGEGTSLVDVPDWKPDDTPFAIAEHFLQSAPGRRLQVFANGPVEGWEALVFDEDFMPHLHPALA